MIKSLPILVCLLGLATGLQADNAKVVFISGKPSHGPMAHEHRAGNMLLARALNETDLPIDAIVLPENGYPEDSGVLHEADTIVVFCTGHQNHLLNPNLEEFDEIMRSGTGVVMIHWATEAVIGPPANKFLEWMGGFCALNWSVNPHWAPNFTEFPDHPVSQGLTPFSLDDEWYYHMRFVPDLEGVTPILSAVPGEETLKRPDGVRSGNPDVRAAVARGESQHVAWAYDRPDGIGRGFGFTGAHNHVSWQDRNFRTVILNAIVWTAGLDVPEGGVPSRNPTDEEIQQNLDDKQPRQPRQQPQPQTEQAEVTIPTLNEARKGQVRQMDRNAAFELLATTLTNTEDPAIQGSLLRGLLLGLEGERDLTVPAALFESVSELGNSPNQEIRGLTQRLGQIFGDEAATQRALETVASSDANLPDRLTALESLRTQQNEALLPLLPPLLDNDELRIQAIRTYGNFESADAPEILLSHYADFPTDAQRAVIETLSSRRSYAEALFGALESGDVPREAIPAYVARSLGRILGGKFNNKYGVQELDTNVEEAIARYRAFATEEAMTNADAAHGRVVYNQLCVGCHKMYGEGGIVGPDLTGSNRADLSYLLLNIMDPSGDIPEAYQMVTVTTYDGRVLVGSVTAEDDLKLTLSMVGQSTTVVKSDIERRVTSPVSMMPAGLLQNVPRDDVLDFFKYMQTTSQVELP